MAFIYKSQNGLLTPSQETLLGNIENLPSPFNGIANLEELRTITGVSVVVSDKAYLKKMLIDSINSINAHIESTIFECNNNTINGKRIIEETKRDLSMRSSWAKDQLKYADNLNVVPLLGLYTRKLLWFDNSEPTVFLFADNIMAYAKRKGVQEDNVFAYVFIHEMMHAYYDAFNSEGFPSREPLEEAFAEYGMLTFIDRNKSKLPPDLLKDASGHVKSKISYGPYEYGFGYDLFDITVGNVEMINRYKEISNWIDWDVIQRWPSGNRYFEDIKNYPSKCKAKKCYDGVLEILDYPWGKPLVTIQPCVNLVAPGVSSPISKKLICSDKYLKHFVHDVFLYLYRKGLLGRLKPYLISLSPACRLALIGPGFKLLGIFWTSFPSDPSRAFDTPFVINGKTYYLSNQWRNGGKTNDLQFSEFVNMINQVFPEYEVDVVGGEYVFRLK